MKLKLFLSLLLLLPANLVMAAGLSDAQSGLQTAAGDNFDTSKNIQAYIAILIKGALSLVGIIFIVLIVLAGFKWMTSQGNSTKIDEAKSTIVNSVIGLVVVLAAYAIVTFVFDALQGVNSGGGSGGGSVTP
ncbi:hypothetical protein KBC40_03140 [Patescibacteria group bacterium]|jgi:hypothetical protein|nr:hypothetical protein [Patescibacteria group bacterium]